MDVASDALVGNPAFECSDGAQIASFRDRSWVLTPGVLGEIGGDNAIATDEEYSAAYDRCLG